MTSTIALMLCLFPSSAVWLSSSSRSTRPVFGKAALLHRCVELLQRLEQRAHQLQRPGIGPVGQRFLRVRMRFHEHARDAGRHRRARQHRHEFALAAARRALPARQLHRMRGIEHHRAAGLAHDHQRAHVGHQVVVAERGAALAHHDVVGCRSPALRLVHHVLHVPGREELALLDVHRLAGCGHGMDEIGLAAQERRRLQYVDHRGDLRRSRSASCTSVSTGTLHLLRTSRENLEALVHAQPAERLARAAVGLVVRRLVDERDAESGAQLLQLPAVSNASCRDSTTQGPAIRNSGRSSPASKPQSFIRWRITECRRNSDESCDQSSGDVFKPGRGLSFAGCRSLRGGASALRDGRHTRVPARTNAENSGCPRAAST